MKYISKNPEINSNISNNDPLSKLMIEFDNVDDSEKYELNKKCQFTYNLHLIYINELHIFCFFFSVSSNRFLFGTKSRRYFLFLNKFVKVNILVVSVVHF